MTIDLFIMGAVCFIVGGWVGFAIAAIMVVAKGANK